MRQALTAMGAILALALASSAMAKPFDAKHVPADAEWLMHVDFDSFRQTKLAEHIRQQRLDDPNVQRWLTWVEERYGINLREDLHGLTIYGTSYEPHHGVILLFGEYDPEKTAKVLEGEPGFKKSEHGDYTLYSWSLEDGRHDQHHPQGTEGDRPLKLTAAFYDKGVVIATSEESVQRALDTLDGTEPALEESSPLLGARPRGTVFYGAAKDLDALKGRTEERLPQFAVLQQGKHINVALGQDEGTAFYRVRFEASSPEVGKILAGFEAMLDLQADADETVANVVKGFKWKVDDTTVSVNWKAKSDDVVELVKQRLEQRPFRQALRQQPDEQSSNQPADQPEVQEEVREEAEPLRR